MLINKLSTISFKLFACAILAGSLAAPVVNAQSLCSSTFAVRSVTKTYTDTARANRRVGVTVFFPTTSSSSNVIVKGCNLPVVSFGHGFTIGNNAYGFLSQGLVPKGYVVVLPSTEGGFSPNHGRFADDLSFVIRAVRADTAFAGAIGVTSAIGGHSMGGGSAIVGASRDPSITALFAFAPADTNPSSIEAAKSVSKPTMIVTGSRDCVTPYASTAALMLANLQTPDSATFDVPISGGSHCQFTTGSFTCGFGEGFCGGRATIPAVQQHSTTLSVLGPFLDAELKQ